MIQKYILSNLLQESDNENQNQHSANVEDEEEGQRSADDPRMLRDILADWFVSEGEVPFQYQYALRTTRNMQ